MGYMKKVIALLLAVSMLACVAVEAFAATWTRDGYVEFYQSTDPFGAKSPTQAIDYYYNESLVPTVIYVEAPKTTAVWLGTVKEYDYNAKFDPKTGYPVMEKPIRVIGNGTLGIFDNKKGQNVVSLAVASTKKVTFNSNFADNSNLAALTIFNVKSSFETGAFEGTNNPNLTIAFMNTTKSSQVWVAKKGAFEGLGKGATIIVCKYTQDGKKLSKKEFKKLKKKLKKRGFQGKIIYYTKKV